MIEVKVLAADSRQRADKYILNLLPGAGKSLIYKQIRKKNITLNGKKMTGNELLNAEDRLQFFFSEDTFNKFKNAADESDIRPLIQNARNAYRANPDIEIVYEDDNIICINKPDNMLSQKADSKELSLNEWLIGYLLHSEAVSEDSLRHFKPSVLNRLDKNTSGLVLGSKTLLGANVISELLRDRSLDKYYLTVVKGSFNKDGIYNACHYKNEATNMVKIAATAEELPANSKISEIQTGIKLLQTYTHDSLGEISLLLIELITGKTHQIRAHLAFMGYPVIGDSKYGKKEINAIASRYGIKHQMLHSYRMKMPNNLPDTISNLNGLEIICNPPHNWRKINVDLENKRS